MVSAWQSRLVLIIGPEGYKEYMRRSIQTVVLYEAKRCISPRLEREKLRPFQKRELLMVQIYGLLDELAFLDASQKEQVLWKTQKNQEQLDDVTAWKRCGIIDRDLGTARKELQPFVSESRTQQKAVDLLVEHAFNALKQAPTLRPIQAPTPTPQWEYLHNHTFVTLRLYFLGSEFDPNFPEPEGLPDTYPVPVERPPSDKTWHRTFAASVATAAGGPNVAPIKAAAAENEISSALLACGNPGDTASSTSGVPAPAPTMLSSDSTINKSASIPAKGTSERESALARGAASSVSKASPPESRESSSDLLSDSKPSSEPAPAPAKSTVQSALAAQRASEDADDARLRFMSVRDQMDLLNRFQGVMPEEELSRRKRELYKLMPETLPTRSQPPHEPPGEDTDGDLSPLQKKKRAI